MGRQAASGHIRVAASHRTPLGVVYATATAPSSSPTPSRLVARPATVCLRTRLVSSPRRRDCPCFVEAVASRCGHGVSAGPRGLCRANVALALLVAPGFARLPQRRRSRTLVSPAAAPPARSEPEGRAWLACDVSRRSGVLFDADSACPAAESGVLQKAGDEGR